MNSQQTITGHRLEINIIKGKELKPTNWFSKTADAFVMLKTQDQVPHQSQVAWKTTNPEWNEKITVELSEKPEEDIIFLEVWGKHVVGSNTFMGRCQIPVSVLLKNTEGKFANEEIGEKWFKLLPKGAKVNFQDFPGSILLRFNYIYAPVVSTIPQQTNANIPNHNNAVLYYACPVCKQLFPPNTISSHMDVHIQQQVASLAACQAPHSHLQTSNNPSFFPMPHQTEYYSPDCNSQAPQLPIISSNQGYQLYPQVSL